MGVLSKVVVGSTTIIESLDDLYSTRDPKPLSLPLPFDKLGAVLGFPFVKLLVEGVFVLSRDGAAYCPDAYFQPPTCPAGSIHKKPSSILFSIWQIDFKCNSIT